MWLHTMKGFNFSAGLTITSPKSRKAVPSSTTEEGEKDKGFLGKLFGKLNFTK